MYEVDICQTITNQQLSMMVILHYKKGIVPNPKVGTSPLQRIKQLIRQILARVFHLKRVSNNIIIENILLLFQILG